MSASDGSYAPLWDADAAGPVEVGIDVIEIDRIRATLDRFGPRFLNRVFSVRERERYGRRPSELAARFAAKEATMKALGTGVRGVRWRDIEVLPNSRGKPIIVLHGSALERASLLGFRHVAVSLTHSRTEAMALVVATKLTRDSGEMDGQ
ncbi:MAG TPA: holo-ACP synthase [Thermomicrobiaceae bacterium]|nr:holo-ACP synthase [Thermomicrobiaceae bacterium]